MFPLILAQINDSKPMFGPEHRKRVDENSGFLRPNADFTIFVDSNSIFESFGGVWAAKISKVEVSYIKLFKILLLF